MKTKEVKNLEKAIISGFNKMAAQSLPPESYEALAEIIEILKNNRHLQ